MAAIEGIALGGGCEIALACNARVAAPGTSIGLPELQLGIIPGFGGTQRLPRVAGLARALPMMLTSAPVKEGAALEAGLVDAVVPAERLLAAARQMALDIAGAGRGGQGVWRRRGLDCGAWERAHHFLRILSGFCDSSSSLQPLASHPSDSSAHPLGPAPRALHTPTCNSHPV